MKPTQNKNNATSAKSSPRQSPQSREPGAAPIVHTMPRRYKSDFQRITDKEDRIRAAQGAKKAGEKKPVNVNGERNAERPVRRSLPNYTAPRRKKNLTFGEALFEELKSKVQQLGLVMPFTAEQFIRAAICGALIIVFALLQTTVFARFKPFGAIPDLMFSLTIAIAFSEGEKWGGICGLVCAVVADALGGIGFTVEPLLYMLAGCFCGILVRDFFSNTALPRAAVIFLFTFARSAVSMIGSAIMVPEASFLQVMTDIVIPEYFSTVLMSVPVYLAVWLCFVRFHKTRAERTS